MALISPPRPYCAAMNGCENHRQHACLHHFWRFDTLFTPPVEKLAPPVEKLMFTPPMEKLTPPVEKLNAILQFAWRWQILFGICDQIFASRLDAQLAADCNAA